jgi:hypothetical protein
MSATLACKSSSLNTTVTGSDSLNDNLPSLYEHSKKPLFRICGNSKSFPVNASPSISLALRLRFDKAEVQHSEQCLQKNPRPFSVTPTVFAVLSKSIAKSTGP